MEHAVQLEATLRTLPPFDIHGTFQRWIGAYGNRVTGAAWLSSARVVRCWVKSRNERNPYPYLPAGNAGNSKETAGDKPEEGGDEVKSSWPLLWWATSVLQWEIQRAAIP